MIKIRLIQTLLINLEALGTAVQILTVSANPDPTYYRNLPSYYSTALATPERIESQRQFFLANSQINWDAIYYGNTEAVTNSDNIEIGRRAKESGTILYEDRTDDKQWTANTILNSQLSDNIILNAGATYRKLKSENFQNVLDLLGGSFILISILS